MAPFRDDMPQWERDRRVSLGRVFYAGAALALVLAVVVAVIALL